MNRSELVDQIANVAGIEKRHAESAVSAFVDSVVTAAKAGERLSIFGFGTFTPSHQPARTGRNPRTGAPVKVSARNVVKFKPATALREALNTRGGKKVVVKKAAAKKRTAKAPARKATAKKATAKRAGAKKTTKKASPARKSTRKS